MASYVANVVEEIREHLASAGRAADRIDGSAGKNVEVELGLASLREELDGVLAKLDRALIGAAPVSSSASVDSTSTPAE